MKGLVEGINTDVLKECRLQLGMNLSEVSKKVPKISEIESGKKKPTFNQIQVLADLYAVPRWVFIASRLPEHYKISNSIPNFRKLAGSQLEILESPRIKKLITKIERKREMLLDLATEIDAYIPDFRPPSIKPSNSPSIVAERVRDWLGVGKDHLSFQEWKTLVEGKGIFVFLTSKYKGWSHIEIKTFRGLSVFHSKLPIIIINNSDSKKAQSFTLFHELGHLLKEEDSFDVWESVNLKEEEWCDSFAGSLLMPEEEIINARIDLEDFSEIKRKAKSFKVSTFALVVRLWKLNLISYDSYQMFIAIIRKEYEEYKTKLRDSDGGPSRNRVKEVVNDYGFLYSRVIFDAFSRQEIGISKTAQLFDLKNPSNVFKVSGYI